LRDPTIRRSFIVSIWTFLKHNICNYGYQDINDFRLSLAVAEGLDAVASVLSASLDPRWQPSSSSSQQVANTAAVTELALMHPETFGKVCVAIDDLMPDVSAS
jgi:hypothetical protein